MENAILKTTKIVVYKSRADKELTQQQIEALKNNWKAIEYNGFMSDETKKKLSRKLSAWSRSIELGLKYSERKTGKYNRHINFLTLTIPFQQSTEDNHIKRHLFTPFISLLKHSTDLMYYFWKAESQGNGNIHFHVLIDCYIDKNEVNKYWNKLCYNYNKNYNKNINESILSAPSTKIESPKNGDSIEKYVLKYALKEDGHRKINGRIWGMSDELREIDVPIMEMNNDLAEIITDLTKTKKINMIVSDYFCIYDVDIIAEENYLGHKLQDILIMHYLDIYSWLYVGKSLLIKK